MSTTESNNKFFDAAFDMWYDDSTAPDTGAYEFWKTYCMGGEL